MTLKEAESFVKAVLAQQQLNREAHGDTEADDKRDPMDWGVIAGEHMGHLLGALHSGNDQLIENEILHVAGPLLECWNAIKTKTSVKQVFEYKCTSCGEVFSLDESNNKCPLCESMLEKVKASHIKKITHEDLMRETSEQESLRMKAAVEVIKAAGWYEAGGISFYFHPNSCYWMDLNTGIIAIYHKDRKDIGGIDSVADGYAYTGEDALSWIRKHDQ